MSTVPDTDEAERGAVERTLLAVHATLTAGQKPYCRACGTEPPCLVVRALDRLAAATAENERLTEELDDGLRDQHARYHDEPGNMLGHDECGWERCGFWDAAEWTLNAPKPETTRLAVATERADKAEAAVEAIPAEPISVEFRQRLIAAVERPLRVRREILLLAGHASGHLPGGSDRGCRCCMRDWPCEEAFRAARSALDAFADDGAPQEATR